MPLLKKTASSEAGGKSAQAAWLSPRTMTKRPTSLSSLNRTECRRRTLQASSPSPGRPGPPNVNNSHLQVKNRHPFLRSICRPPRRLSVIRSPRSWRTSTCETTSPCGPVEVAWICHPKRNFRHHPKPRAHLPCRPSRPRQLGTRGTLTRHLLRSPRAPLSEAPESRESLLRLLPNRTSNQHPILPSFHTQSPVLPQLAFLRSQRCT